MVTETKLTLTREDISKIVLEALSIPETDLADVKFIFDTGGQNDPLLMTIQYTHVS